MEEIRLMSFEDGSEERRRKRKQSFANIVSEEPFKMRQTIKAELSVKDEFEIVRRAESPQMIVSDNDWQYRPTSPSIGLSNKIFPGNGNKVDDNFEDLCGTWVIDSNVVCLVKNSSDDIQIADTETYSIISTTTSSPRSPVSTATMSNKCSQSNCLEERDQSNLSWLLNFKVDSLFKSEDIQHDHDYLLNKKKTVSVKGIKRKTVDQDSPQIQPQPIQVGLCSSDSKSNSRKFQDKTLTVNENENRKNSRKPPFTYSELIERALKEFGELTVSAIYNWISVHYPYYEANDERWKNSVRHNLSINPYFRKGRKSPQGAGHLWCIAASCKDGAENRDEDMCYMDVQGMSLAEVEAATASIEEDKENRHLTPDELYFFEGAYTQVGLEGELGGQSLIQTAEEVLKGVKKNVEVQYVSQSRKKFTDKESEFLNPIPVKEVVEESGLSYQLTDYNGAFEDKNSGFYITEINPEALGINMVGSELIAGDLLFGEHDLQM